MNPRRECPRCGREVVHFGRRTEAHICPHGRVCKTVSVAKPGARKPYVHCEKCAELPPFGEPLPGEPVAP